VLASRATELDLALLAVAAGHDVVDEDARVAHRVAVNRTATEPVAHSEV
jgi:hypothetical protein